MKIKELFKNKRIICGNASIYLKVAYLLLGSIFFPTFFSSFLFIFNIVVGPFHYIISILLLLISYFFVFYDNSVNKKTFIIPIFVSLLIVFFSILLSNVIYDTSWDGWSYHIPSIIRLKNGWNPLYVHDDSILTWIVHYPKFIWIYGSNLYSTFGNMFIGTSFNLIIAFSLLFVSIDVLRKYKANKFVSVLIGIVFAFNPITVGQLFSYYNDGVLGICIISLLLLFTLVLDKKEDISKSIIWYLIIMYSSILAGIKFTGALFALIILVVYFLIFFALKIVKINKHIFYYATTMGIGVLVVAINTYLPNYIHHNNIGYPLIGEDKVDIITSFIPVVFEGDSNVKAFVKSVTMNNSNQNNRELDKVYSYRPMYIFNRDDILCVSMTDCRIGGFGPQYPLIIVLSSIIFVGVLISKNNIALFKKNKINYLKLYFPELVIFVVSIILFLTIPATWWMRYIPFMYLLPFLMIIKRFNMNNNSFINACIHILIFISFFFSLVFVYNRIEYAKEKSDLLKDQIVSVANDINNGYKVAELEHNTFYYKIDVRRALLGDMGLKYTEIKDSLCNKTTTYGTLGIMTVDCGGKNE